MMNEIPKTKTRKDLRSVKAEEPQWFVPLLQEVFLQVLWFSRLDVRFERNWFLLLLGLSDVSSGGSSGLDLSEFPALANRSRIESLSRVEGVARLESIGGVSAPPSSMASRPSYGVVSKPAEPPPDFSIHNEDFPALPGSNTFKSGTVSNGFPH